MAAKVFENGAWRDVKSAKVFENGAWRDVNQMNVYENGAWRKVYPTLPVNVTNVSIGEEVTIPHAVYGNIPFIVIGRNHDAPNSVTLLTKEIIREVVYDCSEAYDVTAGGNVLEYNGSTRYIRSNVARWMNSTEPAGSWFTPYDRYDLCSKNPTRVTDFDQVFATTIEEVPSLFYEDGLLRGFSQEVQDQMITVTKSCIDEDVADFMDKPWSVYNSISYVNQKVFLLSMEELGCTCDEDYWYLPQNEGTVYEYFTNESNKNIIPPISQYYRNLHPNLTTYVDNDSYLDCNDVWYRNQYWTRSSTYNTIGYPSMKNYKYASMMVMYKNRLDIWGSPNDLAGLRFAICLKTTV